MARASEHEPHIIDLLKSHPDGISAADIGEQIGCSRQLVYKVLNKPTTHVTVIGKSPTGAELWTWREPQSLTGRGLPTIGAIFQVVRMEQVDTKVRVVLRSETGDELEYLS